MAGLVSSAEVWAKDYDPEWRARLAEDNLSYFHMHAFEQSFHQPEGPFDASWVGHANIGKRRRLLGDLLDIIRPHAWQKFGCILPEEKLLLFSDVSRENYIPTRIATAGRLIWGDVEGWRKRKRYRNQAEMIFESGDIDKGSLMKAMKDMTGQDPFSGQSETRKRHHRLQAPSGRRHTCI